MIYTSYFKSPLLKKFKGEQISIARFKPFWFEGRSISVLGPRPETLNRYKSSKRTRKDQEQYIREYLDYLETFPINRIKEILEDGMVLLCYERPDEFCHRHILAQYLRDNGVEILELR